MNDEKIYVGLDIGTESVGWAVTDGEYKLRKFRGNLMWGVHLFDEANQAAERRTFRTARRRLDRRQQRILLLQELLGTEILGKDPHFFLRLKESGLLPCDSQYRTNNLYFDDAAYKDADYYKEFPTIHHLICELILNPAPHDIRLIYIACAYLLAHRGHFLRDVEPEKTEKLLDFSGIYEALLRWMNDNNLPDVFPSDSSIVKRIMQNSSGVKDKEQELKKTLFGGTLPKFMSENETAPAIDLGCLLKLMAGGTVKLSALFRREAYKDLEKDSVCVANSDFSEELPLLFTQLDDGYGDLLLCVMNIYEWSLLMSMLGDEASAGENLISRSKVRVYEEHQRDLRDLKDICRKYLSSSQYDEIFRDETKANNYVWYSYHFRGKTPERGKRATQDNFCKFIKKYLESIKPNENDLQKHAQLLQKASAGKLCPRQVTTDNRVIPYQLYYLELKQILERAQQYTPILRQEDAYGTVADKILSIMSFKIPYYVGPLVSASKSSHAWLERKKEGKIYPWNFDEMVDHQKCEDAFIRRMTGTCTYLAGEPVLPKYSLLYSKFCVLNEINSIAIDGERISVECKQQLYHDLFELSKQRVTKKRVKDYLVGKGIMQREQTLSGVDDVIKSSLKSYHDFQVLPSGVDLPDFDIEQIIERITVTTDKKRLRNWLKEQYPQLTEKDARFISNLGYQDYGKLSRRFLEEIYSVIQSTGECTSSHNLITALWESNENLMQLLSENYYYNERIKIENAEYYAEHPVSTRERMEALYLPKAVQRSVTRTLDIVVELKKLLPQTPDRIFIEMARGGTPEQKGKRVASRKQQIETWLNSMRQELPASEYDALSSNLARYDDQQLRREKLFLYFMQLGKCMYSGKQIDLDSIGNDALYNIDHIYPQSKTMDDSLDNKVLVLSSINGSKSDRYPIDRDIRNQMHSFWSALRTKNLISQKKYERLTRSTPLNDEELRGFIQRQLVETRQSTKAVAVLLKEIFPDTEIVYVKAGLTSQLRHDLELWKCREINDLHHAKDAYLNIVIGNIYHERFTKRFFERIGTEQYSLRLYEKKDDGERRGLLTYPINNVWNTKFSMAVVRRMMQKNSIRYVRYCYRRKHGQNGGFYDQNPLRAGKGMARRKNHLPIESYGGYDNATISFYMIVSVAEKGVVLVPIELLYAERFENDSEFALEYAAIKASEIMNAQVHAGQISFPLGKRVIKINTLLEFDGFRINMSAKTGNRIRYVSSVPLVLSPDDERYVKRLVTYAEKSENGKKYGITAWEHITAEENMALFDVIVRKCTTKPFSQMFGDIGIKIQSRRGRFAELDLQTQTLSLLTIVSLLKCGRKGGINLTIIGEGSQVGTKDFNMQLSRITQWTTLHIIDQSPTGLIERCSDNLLKL